MGPTPFIIHTSIKVFFISNIAFLSKTTRIIAGDARIGRQRARRRATGSVAREASLRQEEEGRDPARARAPHDADDARTRRVRSILSTMLPSPVLLLPVLL